MYGIYAYIRIQIIVEIKTVIVVLVRVLPVRVLPVRFLLVRVLLVRALLACENSRPSSLPAEWRFARRTSAIHRRKFHTDDANVNFIILNKLSFAVTKGLCQAANVLHSHKCTS